MAIPLRAQLQPPAALLFDWEGTLVDTAQGIWRALNEALCTVHGAALPWEVFQGWAGLSFEDMVLRLRARSLDVASGGHNSLANEEAAARLRSVVQDCLKRARPSVQPGALDVLRWGRAVRCPMAVVSNASGAALRLQIHQMGWQPFFFAVVGAGDCAARKPSPAPLQQALQGQGLMPSHRIWFVGDSPSDWACAQQAGCRAIVLGAHGAQVGVPGEGTKDETRCVDRGKASLAEVPQGGECVQDVPWTEGAHGCLHVADLGDLYAGLQMLAPLPLSQ